MGHNPEILKCFELAIQACVPDNYTDDQIISFIDKEEPCGTGYGWFICKEGHMNLGGAKQKIPCEDRAGFVHVVVGC